MTLGNTHEKKTICLIKIDNHIYKDIPPLGLLYLGDALKQAGYLVELYHIVDHEIPQYADKILRNNPLFVGFSVVTGWGIKPAADLSRLIKKASHIPVVWGNVHPSHLPEQCLKEPYVDIVCIGEGEETVVDLANALDQKKDLSEVAGIGYKNEGLITINPGRPRVRDLDKFEVDWSLVDINRYITPCWGMERTLRVIASRGCPFHCSFCYNQAFHKRIWRYHSAQYVIRRLSALAEAHHLDAFYFNDDNFFVNREWAWEILEAIGLPYYVCLRSELINDEFAKRLSDTGCREVLIGFESGSDAVLKRVLKKGISAGDNFNAVETLCNYPHIKITGSFITGLPGETEADTQKTIRMMCDFLRIHPNFRVILAFYRPMPGTELYEVALANGFAAPKTTEDWSTFDALANTLELPWLDSTARARAASLCMAMDTLAALYKFNVPILKNLVRRSILNGHYDHQLLRLINNVRTRYAFGDAEQEKTFLLRLVVNAVKKWKKLD